MRRSAIKTGLQLSCLPTAVLTLWVTVATLRSFPTDGTLRWFMESALSLGLLFAVVSGWHGLGAGLAIRSSVAFSTNLSRGFRIFVVALIAASGSLSASLIGGLILVFLFPTSVKGLERVTLIGTIAYAAFFGMGFAYRHYRQRYVSGNKTQG